MVRSEVICHRRDLKKNPFQVMSETRDGRIGYTVHKKKTAEPSKSRRVERRPAANVDDTSGVGAVGDEAAQDGKSQV